MSRFLFWLIRMVILALLQIRYPAAICSENQTVRQEDPSYAIYQNYRYAYDTYGYLFLSGEGGQKHVGIQTAAWQSAGGSLGAAEAGAVSGAGGEPQAGTPAGQAGGTEGAGGGGPEGNGQTGKEAAVTMAQLQDYDYLMKTFYNVHTSTTAGRDLMRAETFLQTDLHLEKRADVPQILIYHTHSQETYADYGPGNQEATVVANGAYLARLLQARGWNVIHDTSSYDIKGGALDRNRAYTYALEGITGILQRYPTIEVILDLHRDGVREGLHLVSEVNGKPTASVMFFQGMSRTPDGPIEYLPNPYIKENLAFTFQMQLAAAGRYPGLTRKIYLKGLRYNLHLRPRSALIEVGAQTNTGEEARNAMEPLAELLDMVLQGN